jgi:hypothetical protein
MSCDPALLAEAPERSLDCQSRKLAVTIPESHFMVERPLPCEGH